MDMDSLVCQPLLMGRDLRLHNERNRGWRVRLGYGGAVRKEG